MCFKKADFVRMASARAPSASRARGGKGVDARAAAIVAASEMPPTAHLHRRENKESACTHDCWREQHRGPKAPQNSPPGSSNTGDDDQGVSRAEWRHQQPERGRKKKMEGEKRDGRECRLRALSKAMLRARAYCVPLHISGAKACTPAGVVWKPEACSRRQPASNTPATHLPRECLSAPNFAAIHNGSHARMATQV